MIPIWRTIPSRTDALSSSDHSGFSGGIGGRIWRFIVCDVVYLVIYLVAGMLIYPFVRDFYTRDAMPSIGLIITLQLFLRGPAFVGICILLHGLINRPVSAKPLALGVVFTLISGVAPLIVPNPFFPDFVRWVHLAEVACSNLVLGMFIAWIWSRGSTRVQPLATLAA
jgi:hypothetical protein